LTTYPLAVSIQPIPHPLNSLPIKSVSLQFGEMYLKTEEEERKGGVLAVSSKWLAGFSGKENFVQFGYEGWL